MPGCPDGLRERWSTTRYAVYLTALFAGYLDHLTVPTFLAATLVVSGSVRLAFGYGNMRTETRLAVPVFLPGKRGRVRCNPAAAASYVLSRTSPPKGNLSTAGRARLIDAAGNRGRPSPMICLHIRHV